MTSKTIIIGLVALAFVAGSIMTGTMAEAKKDKSEGNDNNPFKALWDAIENIELTPGPRGETGATGEQGDTGPAADGSGLTIYQNIKSVTVPAGTTRSVTATCDSGDVATGGGINIVGNIQMIDSYQQFGNSVNSPDWYAEAKNVGTNSNDFFYAIVLCLDKTP